MKNKRNLKLSLMTVAVSQCLAITAPQAATLTVSTAFDSLITPACSLRAAIGAINAGRNENNCVDFSGDGFGVDDTIQFSSFFNTPRTINLASNGELQITKSVTINGPGEDRLTIDGNGNSRVFFVNGVEVGLPEADNVDINNMTVTNASTSGNGGGVYVNGADSLRLSNLTISQSRAYGGAGAQLAYADDVAIDNITVVDNTASQSGGGLYIFVSSEGQEQTISNSQFSRNSAVGFVNEDGGRVGGGGIALNYTSGVTLHNTRVSDNSTRSNGGGILINSSPGTTIRESTISGNIAAVEGRNRRGGGIAILLSNNTNIEDSVVSNNSSDDLGGGISVNGSDGLTIYRTKVDNNATEFSGGGVYALGTANVMIRDSSIDGNSSSLNGGGVSIRGGGDNHSIRSTTISRNRANQNGGGLHTYSSDVYIDIVTSTFSGNSAVANGGGMYVGQGARAYLFSNTITGNFANNGAGIFRDDQATQIVSNFNNVIANSRGGPDCGNADGLPILMGMFDRVEDGSCSRAADGDPRLGSLRDNGGFGRTHAPQPGSNLIGAGGACELVDQRGVQRPFFGCIIGSVEVVVEESSIFVVPLPSGGVVTFEL